MTRHDDLSCDTPNELNEPARRRKRARERESPVWFVFLSTAAAARQKITARNVVKRKFFYYFAHDTESFHYR